MIGLFEAIKKGFGIATKGMGLVSILILFNLVANFASLPFAAIEPGATPPPQMTAGAIIFSVVFILLSIFFQGGTLGLVRDAVKEGQMRLAAFISYGLKYYLKLLGLGLIIILIIAIVALIAGLIVVAAGPLNSTLVSGIAIIIAVVIAVVTTLLYFIPFMLAPYALICEELGVIESLKRSLKVAKEPFLRVFLTLLFTVILVLISLGIGLVVGFLAGMLSAVVPAEAGRIVMTVVTSVINGYLGVVMTASFMVFYLGLAGKEEKPVPEKIF